MKESSLHAVADFGFGVLEAMVETAAYTIEKVPSMGRIAIFFRLLKDSVDKKGKALLESISNEDSEKRFAVKLDSFSLVPNSPFSYWVKDCIRYKFRDFPPFEADGRTAKTGLSTSDDFRFIRANWEVNLQKMYTLKWSEFSSSKDSPDTIREQYRMQASTKKWVNFAKGGEYSPYYADLHLVVNWYFQGKELRSCGGNVRNEDKYFLAGLTWPLRALRFNPVPLPVGSIFSVRGYAIIADDIWDVFSKIQSNCFEFLFRLSMEHSERPNFIVGILQTLPWPEKSLPSLKANIKNCVDYRIKDFTFEETAHVFSIPALLFHRRSTFRETGVSLDREKAVNKERIDSLQKQINNVVYDLYNIDPNDREVIENELVWKKNSNQDENENLPTYIQDILQWCIGVIFGRWDIRMALDPILNLKLTDPFNPLPVCSPGMLVGPDGLPAKKGQIVSKDWLRTRKNALDIPEDIPKSTITDEEYPIKTSWNGILVDDPGHEDDIIKRLREVLGLIWTDKAQEIEKEACENLGIKLLRDYFRKKFFPLHIKRYSKSGRKAPIYWQLSTKKGNYSLWLYYHRLTSDILFLALRNFIDPKVEYEVTKLREIKAKLESQKNSLPRSQITKIEKEIENQADFVLEIKGLKETLEKIAQRGYNPDFDDGVILNMAPLHEVIPWNEPAEYWKDLEKGEYDWARIAMKYWPERVKEKCKKDKSLAIAHGLEELYGAK